jgi:hypothetical protein
MTFNPGPCPRLIDDKRTSCGILAEHPEEMERLLIGRGCGKRAGLTDKISVAEWLEKEG